MTNKGSVMSKIDIIKKHGLKGSPAMGLAMATFGFFIGFAAVSLYGPVAAKLKDILGISGFLLGLLVAAPNLSGSLLRIPFSAWVDKVGGKKPILILFLLSLIGMVGLTTLLILYYPSHFSRDSYWLIVLFGILSGSGIAIFSPGIAQTSYWYPNNKQGFALGAYAGFGNLAPGLIGIFLPIALHGLGLTDTYLLWLGFLLAGTVLYWIFAHDSYYFQLVKQGIGKHEAIEIAKQLDEEHFPTVSTLESLKISAMVPSTWALVALYFTSFGGFLALTVWFPTYWSKSYHFDLREAGLLMAVGFSLLSSLIRVWGGSISDKFGGEAIAILSYFVVLVGASIIFFAHDVFWIAVTGEVVIGAGMGIANAAVFKLVPKYVPNATGGAAGWVGGLGAFGGFVVPPILGIFIDRYGVAGYEKGFSVYMVLAVISIIISFVLLVTHRHDV